MKITETLGKAFTPSFIRPKMRDYFQKAGLDDIPYKTFGRIFYIAFILTLIIYIFAIYPVITTHTLDYNLDVNQPYDYSNNALTFRGTLDNSGQRDIPEILVEVTLYNNSNRIAADLKKVFEVDIKSSEMNPTLNLNFDDVAWNRREFSEFTVTNLGYKPSPLSIVGLTFLFWFIVLLGISLLFYLMLYYKYDVKIYNRTKQIEEVLPDFLQYVSENLRAGMSFDQALWKAVRPEFDVLASEIIIVSKNVSTGDDVSQALMDFTKKYNSPTLKRTFALIVESVKGGGEMASIIDNIVDNLRETHNLREEIRATSLNYVYFISIIVVAVAPFLFAMAYQLLTLITGFTATLGSSVGNTPGMISISSEPALTSNDFVMFSRIAILIIAGFAAIIVSLIRTGSVRGGAKYIPLYMILAYLVYAVAMFLFGLLFGGISL